jgi:hypothetical protein
LIAAGTVIALTLTHRSSRHVAVHTLLAHADFPDALVPLPDGGLLYAEKNTGRVREVTSSGRLRPRPVASVKVEVAGQRGLLGLALAPTGSIFACWVDPRGQIVVGRVAPGPARIVWRGPTSTEVANGGRLAFAPDGSLVVGIGNLENAPLASDPSAPNGKLLELNPDGPPTQRPKVISSDWHNPFAFTFTPNGQLWVADNSPGDAPERLARGDAGGRPADVTNIEPLHTVPSGLAALSDHELVMCGYLSHTLQLYRIGQDGLAGPDGGPLADDCALGVVVAGNGSLVYANTTSIRELRILGPSAPRAWPEPLSRRFDEAGHRLSASRRPGRPRRAA